MALGAALVLKLVLFLGLAAGSQMQPGALALGHDAAEYVLYAQIGVDGEWDQIPPEIRRHHPGWPLILSLWSGEPGLPRQNGGWDREVIRTFLGSPTARTMALAGVVLGWLGWTFGLVLLMNLRGRDPRYAFLATAGYPALVYYGNFALTEGIFFALIAGALWQWVRGWRDWIAGGTLGRLALAMVLCGFWLVAAELVRGVALMGAAGLAGAGLVLVWNGNRFSHRPGQGSARERIGTVIIAGIPLAMAVLGYVAMGQVLAGAFAGGTGAPADAVRPVYGIPPFAGVKGLEKLGVVRGGYILLSLVAILALIGWGVGRVVTWRPRRLASVRGVLIVGASAMAGMMTLFHLSIESLDYYNRTIPLANYQDRYGAPFWPLLLLVVPRRRIPWWVVGALTVGSVGLSLWWGRGYLAALTATGHPILGG